MEISESLHTISRHYCVDAMDALQQCLPLLDIDEPQLVVITERARALIESSREHTSPSVLQRLLQEFALDSEEGRALMSLAEALLRIPDRAVAQALIADQLQRGNWRHRPGSHSPLVARASGLLLALGDSLLGGIDKHTLLKKLSSPVAHHLLLSVIRRLAQQFVFAEDIDGALHAAGKTAEQAAWRYSFDMLGEAAVCQAQADAFLDAYSAALRRLANRSTDTGRAAETDDASLSIKLSALSPRFEYAQHARVVPQLLDRLAPLLEQAAAAGVGITFDAEEADKLDLQLAMFGALFQRYGHRFNGRFGLAVQAYGTRALPVLQFLLSLAQSQHQRIALRLVKGAYWDSEIKQAQIQGLASYPVYTDKLHTDLSYLACAQFLLAHNDYFYPQFATHNPVAVAHLLSLAGAGSDFEFQRLHGMGEALYSAVLRDHPQLRCRVYCPVGNHRQLLPYLVRRILENGANDSIVRQLAGTSVAVDELAQHPLTRFRSAGTFRSQLPLPSQLFAPVRRNSPTVNLASWQERTQLLTALRGFAGRCWSAAPLTAAPGTTEKVPTDDAVAVLNPVDGSALGQCHFTPPALAQAALTQAVAAFSRWRQTTAAERADRLDAFAELMIAHRDELLALLLAEAGKTLADAINEFREAIDFARYYAAECRRLFITPSVLPGPEGERNTLGWEGRGVFLCISPWNFPLAIFAGQVCAALAAGNCVLAKPAEDTPIIAVRVVGLLHCAGFDRDVVQCLPGVGASIGAVLLTDARLAGVAFTGSITTARQIHRHLAARDGAIAPLIAETGGLNAMIVDSSALPEQVVRDVIHSAFGSAGQRCSALRVLFLQAEISESVLTLLYGAMASLGIGDPAELETDVGPVINAQAAAQLNEYSASLRAQGKLLYEVALPAGLSPQHFVPPQVFALESMAELREEAFGPLLHVVTYAYGDLPQVVAQINASGFGLTVGIHSRNQSLGRQLAAQLRVGNVYINRAMTGAVVGVQPFGGMGLSGTGPKAGGPNYLQRFAVEKTVSNNIAAIGGNIQLLAATRMGPGA